MAERVLAALAASGAEEGRGRLGQTCCNHPLATLLTVGKDLDDVVQVECAAGCAHRLYLDRGPLECLCYWPVAKAVQVARVISDWNGVATGRVLHGLQLSHGGLEIYLD